MKKGISVITKHLPRNHHLARILLVTLWCSTILLLLGTTLGTISPAHASSLGKAHPARPQSAGFESVVFVHGFDMQSIPGLIGDYSKYKDGPSDCVKYWGPAIDYIFHQAHGSDSWNGTDYRTVGYQGGDQNCSNGQSPNKSSELHQYDSHCTNYPGGSYIYPYQPYQDKTSKESIYHLSCLFSWYMYYNFGQYGWSSVIVAHSMGGLIVRNAIYQVQRQAQLGGHQFPTTMGTISDIVDFGSPHLGLADGSIPVCPGIPQCVEMSAGSYLTNEMSTVQARNPQAGSTDWTLIASQCDQLMFDWSAVGIYDVNHRYVYTSYSPLAGQVPPSCRAHPDEMQPGSGNPDAWDASLIGCDGQSSCNIPLSQYRQHYDKNGPRPLQLMLLALWYSWW